jgi:hypothetical protein
MEYLDAIAPGLDKTLVFLMLVTTIIHMVDTLAYSVRLNSVRTGQFALSASLFNVFVLVSRTANTFQAPLIGAIVGRSITTKTDPIGDIRLVVFAATVGTLLGITAIPTFLKLFSKAVAKISATGSVPAIVFQAFSLDNVKRIARSVKRPRKSMLSGLRYRNIPKRIVLSSILITGIYTIGVLAANYSAYLVPPGYAIAASNSSGMINSIATILLTLFIDPKAAVITDEVYRGKREYGDVKALVVMLIGSKLLGTLLGQLLIVPAAKLIAAVYTGL